MLSFDEFQEKIKILSKGLGEDLVATHLNACYQSTDLRQIFNDYWEKGASEALKILGRILAIGNSYKKIIDTGDFLDFLSEKIEGFSFEKTESASIYDIIYNLYTNDEDSFSRLEENYKISFWGSFQYFAIDLTLYGNNIDTFSDAFNSGIREITKQYRKLSKTNPIILPYCPNGIDDYYIVRYGFDRNNKVLDGLFTNDSQIKSSNSYFFFFHIDLEQKTIHLVCRQPFHTNQLDQLRKSIDGVMWPVCGYEPEYIISFNELEKNGYLKHVDAEVVITKVNSVSVEYNDITIEWNNCFRDYKKIAFPEWKRDTWYSVKELGLRIRKYSGTTKLYTLTGKITKDGVQLNSKEEAGIKKFINYLEGLDLLNLKSEESGVFDLKELIAESVFSKGKFVCTNKYRQLIADIRPYIQSGGYEYCWKSIEESHWSMIAEANVDFEKNQLKFQIWREIKTDRLTDNLFISVDLAMALKKEVNCQFSFKSERDISFIEFSSKWRGDFKNTQIVFAQNVWDLTAYLLGKDTTWMKYLAFIKWAIDDTKKIDLLKKFQCLAYESNYIRQFLHDYKGFVSAESGKIVLPKDLSTEDARIPGRGKGEWCIDIKEIAMSWEGDKFELFAAKILAHFFPVFISLGNHLRWEAVPDGLMVSRYEDSLFMYDAKSSWDVRNYINKEVRKFADYISTLFPKTADNNNVFFIIWPNSTKTLDELSKENIESLKENITWKELIENSKGKVIYLGADILDFLHHILLYGDFDKLKGQIKFEKFAQYFLDLQKNPGISKVDLAHFREYFMKYVLDGMSESNKNVKEFSQNLEHKTSGKLDLLQLSERFKEHINSYA